MLHFYVLLEFKVFQEYKLLLIEKCVKMGVLWSSLQEDIRYIQYSIIYMNFLLPTSKRHDLFSQKWLSELFMNIYKASS
jgi:hypothetical protein